MAEQPNIHNEKTSTSTQQGGLARSLGQFFGHIWKGVRTSPADKDNRERIEIKREVQEEQIEGQDGAERMTLRRTVIEEIEMKRDLNDAADS